MAKHWKLDTLRGIETGEEKKIVNPHEYQMQQYELVIPVGEGVERRGGRGGKTRGGR